MLELLLERRVGYSKRNVILFGEEANTFLLRFSLCFRWSLERFFRKKNSSSLLSLVSITITKLENFEERF